MNCKLLLPEIYEKKIVLKPLFLLPTQVSIGTCDAVHVVTCSDACHMSHDTWHLPLHLQLAVTSYMIYLEDKVRILSQVER